jgi:sirohydrochlorin ferrochelatase
VTDHRPCPPALVAAAHGTRDPDGPRTVERLLERVRRRLPDIEVVASYVELVRPSLADVLAGLRGPAVVVPLLLSTGHHVRADLPAAVANACSPVTLAAPLGPSGPLTVALLDRARGAGAAPRDPLVLAAAGSSVPAAAAAVGQAAGLVARAWDGPVQHGFLSMAEPGVDAALQSAARRTSRPVTVLPYLLAPGRFARGLARLAGDHGARTADVLGAHPRVVDLVVGRYRAHAATHEPAQAG